MNATTHHHQHDPASLSADHHKDFLSLCTSTVDPKPLKHIVLVSMLLHIAHMVDSDKPIVFVKHTTCCNTVFPSSTALYCKRQLKCLGCQKKFTTKIHFEQVPAENVPQDVIELWRNFNFGELRNRNCKGRTWDNPTISTIIS